MRSLLKNKQSMYYALQIGEVPEFETDENGNIRYEVYTDSDGNEFPILDENGNKIPMFTGEYKMLYGEPIEFMGNIAMSGGEAEAVEYGLSVSDFEAIVVYSNGEAPLVEGALIWFKSEVKYKYGGDKIIVEINDISINEKIPNPISADFRVIKVSESLNFTKAILTAVNK